MELNDKINGIINVYKEKGYTSHDVVAKLRGMTGQRKVGHTGTLDPDAEGVLPICFGNATKVCEILTDSSKVYETVLLLGCSTDTQDITGSVTGLGEVSALSDEQIISAVKSFAGGYDQVPPMYSAVKVNGQKLYDVARGGREVEREAKRVEIHSIEILSDIQRTVFSEEMEPRAVDIINRPELAAFSEVHWSHKTEQRIDELYGRQVIRLALRIHCSKGTYIRTICNDIGEKLGVCGCMEYLLRIRVGEFKVEDCIALKDVQKACDEGRFEELLKEPDLCFPEYPKFNSKPEADKLLFNGNPLKLREIKQYLTEFPKYIRLYTSEGLFLGIYEFNEKYRRYSPFKMFK